MRGRSPEQSSMLCLMSLESVVPTDHPLRGIKSLAEAALRQLSPVFDAMYAQMGRPSVPSERLLKGLLLRDMPSWTTATADFVAACRRQGVTPHVAMNDSRRRSASLQPAAPEQAAEGRSMMGRRLPRRTAAALGHCYEMAASSGTGAPC